MAEDGLTRRVADELEIRNLVAKLAQLADEGDLDEYIQLFTEDAGWDGGPALGTSKGHAELLAAARERRASGRSGPGTFTRHVVTTATVDVQGDRATGRAVFHYYTRTNETPVLTLLGVYEDEFVRTERGWCMALRKVLGGAAPPEPS
jgi:3-phenylpropionate/cinnamic acid dioxygenase small subunit